jgi:chromosome segregation ATPase
MDTTQILYLAGAFLLGFIIAWFVGRGGPKRAAEEAAAETDAVRRKLNTAESDLRKTQGQLKENLVTLDQLAADKGNLVKMLRTSEQSLSDAGAELDRLTAELTAARDANLLQQTELGHARDALTVARGQIVDLTARVEAATTIAVEASETAETAVLAGQVESEESAVRMADLESQLALARATAERLAEKEALVAAEVLLRRREYRDVVTGGEDVIVAALAVRDQALANSQTQLDYMRRDLSMLTAAGAQMAVALEQRNREYDTVRDRLVVHETTHALPEVSQATIKAAPVEAAPVESGPDLTVELAVRAAELNALQQRYDELRAALDQAIAERDELQSQLTAHQGSIEELNGKVTEGQSVLENLTAEKDDLLRKLSTRAAVMGTVLAKISDFDEQLRSLVAARTQVENHDAAPAVTDATTQEEEGETHAS